MSGPAPKIVPLLVIAVSGMMTVCAPENTGADAVEDTPGEAPPSPMAAPEGASRELAPVTGVVLIMLDATRADHVSAYGYPRETTPNIDRLAASAVLFEQARSQGPSTKYSLPSLFTGRYYSSIAMGRTGFWREFLQENVTLPERLQSLGFSTGAVVPYFRFEKVPGYSQGFDIWKTSKDFPRKPIWEPVADLVTDKGLTIARELVRTNKPWFLWLHYFDPHSAYVRHPELPEFGTSRVDRYDGEIRFADHHIQRFIDGLAELGVRDRVALIIAGDHGEGLDKRQDHGILYHGFTLFDSEIHVPLIIQTPGVVPGRVKVPVGLLDVPRTVLDLARGATPKPPADAGDMQGISLLPYLLGETPPTRGPVFSEHSEEPRQTATIVWPHKLICTEKSASCALYDLERDPGERNDIAAALPEVVEKLSEPKIPR